MEHQALEQMNFTEYGFHSIFPHHFTSIINMDFRQNYSFDDKGPLISTLHQKEMLTKSEII